MKFDKQAIITSAISVSLGSAVMFGSGALQTFGVYVIGTLAALSLFLLLFGAMKGDVAQRAMEQAPINTALSLYQLLALIHAGYPKLAAFYFVVTFLLVAAAYGEMKKERKK